MYIQSIAFQRLSQAKSFIVESGAQDDVGLWPGNGDFSSDTLKPGDFRYFIILLSSFMLQAYYRHVYKVYKRKLNGAKEKLKN